MRDFAVRARHGSSDGTPHAGLGLGDRRWLNCCRWWWCRGRLCSLSRRGSAFHIRTVDRAVRACAMHDTQIESEFGGQFYAPEAKFSGAYPG